MLSDEMDKINAQVNSRLHVTNFTMLDAMRLTRPHTSRPQIDYVTTPCPCNTNKTVTFSFQQRLDMTNKA